MSSKVINLTSDAIKKSGKRAKSTSPTGKHNSASTSIIDNILKERSASTGTNSPGKKLIIDLAKDNFILTDAKPAPTNNLSKPQPIKPLVSKPIDPVIIDLLPTNTNSTKSKTKSRIQNGEYEDFGDEPMNIDDVSAAPSLPIGKSSGRKSSSPATPAGALGNSVISRAKMDKMQALDAVFLRSTPSPIPNQIASIGHSTQKPRPKSTDPLDFVFDGLPTPRKSPSPQPIQIMHTNQSLPSSTPRVSSPDNRGSKPISNSGDIKIIKSIGTMSGSSSPSIASTPSAVATPDTDLTRQKLDSVNRNIAKIQGKIHEKGAKEKYMVMLKDLEKQKQKYEGRLASSAAKPKSSQPAFPPPSYQESMLGSQNISIGSNHIASPVILEKPRSPILKQTALEKERLATDRELERIRELFPDPKTGTGSGNSKQNQRPKEVQSLFNVSNNLETLREKQKHLEQQHKKLEEQYTHKMKQIDRMRTQKEEMTKLSALELERRKIYEMEQKLKRLDKEQWEEQQRLRKELQTINLGNLQAISRNNNKDVGEFYSLKQDLQGRQPRDATRTTAISPVNTPSSDKIAQFRLVDWFAGFMGSGVDRATSSTGNKKYQPESFKEVDLGQPLLQKTQQPISGYHYYNVDLPSTAWDETTSGTDLASLGWSDQQFGKEWTGNNLISSITVDLAPVDNTDAKPIINQISQISEQLGCQNTILVAKGIDFIVDKLVARYRSGELLKSGQLLGMLTQLIIRILDILTIEIPSST
jgi:hypothetical protein